MWGVENPLTFLSIVVLNKTVIIWGQWRGWEVGSFFALLRKLNEDCEVKDQSELIKTPPQWKTKLTELRKRMYSARWILLNNDDVHLKLI